MVPKGENAGNQHFSPLPTKFSNLQVCDMLENFVGKEEHAGYQHFLLFAPSFILGFFPGLF